jgi:hypothetical protein
MTGITISDPDAQAAEARRHADATREDAHAVSALIDHTSQTDSALCNALQEADHYRAALLQLLHHYEHPVSTVVLCRENALRHDDGAMSEVKVPEYLKAVLADHWAEYKQKDDKDKDAAAAPVERFEEPRKVLARFNTERMQAKHFARNRSISQRLHGMAHNYDRQAEELAKREPQEVEGSAHPALPAGGGATGPGRAPASATNGHPQDGPRHELDGVTREPVPESEHTTEWVMRRADLLGIQDPQAAAEVMSKENLHPGMTPQQAGAAALRAALGDTVTMAPVVVDEADDLTRVLPAVTGESLVDLGPRPFSDSSQPGVLLVGSPSGSGAGDE